MSESNHKLRVLDLFSGIRIGGFSLGLENTGGFETVAFCEIEDFPRKVLAKHWPNVPIHDDVRTLDGTQYRGTVDVVCGGFPCQPYSVAGKQRGTEDHRDLWPSMFRVISEVRPTWVIGENVTNYTNMAFARTKTDLESQGYTVRAFVIPACAVSAEHRRDRVWIIANLNGERRKRSGKKPLQRVTSLQRGKNERGITHSYRRPDLHTPKLCRGGNGVSKRLDACGNAVVPAIPELIGRAILEQELTNA